MSTELTNEQIKERAKIIIDVESSYDSFEEYLECVVANCTHYSHYWMNVIDHAELEGSRVFEDNITMEGGYYIVAPSEDEDDFEEKKITMKDIEEGFYKFYKDYGKHAVNHLKGQGDSSDDDVVMQYAVLGEVVFG